MIPIYQNGNCTDELAGTGVRSCDIESFGDVNGFNLHPKNWSLNVSGSITEESWTELIKGFNVRPFSDIYDFTQDTPENERSTSSRGIMNTIRLGKPQFTFMFTKGGCFHKSLYAHRGSNRWDVSFTFDSGILFAISEDNTKISGFDMGMFDVETFKLQQGTDSQSSTAVMQLIDANQFNTKWVFLTWEQLGVRLSRIEGIVDTTIAYTVEPTTSTTFRVKVSAACNTDDIILGIDDGAKWYLGGTQNTATAITSVAYQADTKDYLFTIDNALVAGDTVQPTLISTGGFDVAEDGTGGLYKGKAPLYEVS